MRGADAGVRTGKLGSRGVPTREINGQEDLRRAAIGRGIRGVGRGTHQAVGLLVREHLLDHFGELAGLRTAVGRGVGGSCQGRGRG